MSLITIIKQLFCKHRFKKYYDRAYGVYLYKCTKCGKLNIE